MLVVLCASLLEHISTFFFEGVGLVDLRNEARENIGRFERKYPTTTWIPEQTAVWSGLVSEAGIFSLQSNLAMSHSCFVDAHCHWRITEKSCDLGRWCPL
jgi:hypothetical protein